MHGFVAGATGFGLWKRIRAFASGAVNLQFGTLPRQSPDHSSLTHGGAKGKSESGLTAIMSLTASYYQVNNGLD